MGRRQKKPPLMVMFEAWSGQECTQTPEEFEAEFLAVRNGDYDFTDADLGPEGPTDGDAPRPRRAQ